MPLMLRLPQMLPSIRFVLRPTRAVRPLNWLVLSLLSLLALLALLGAAGSANAHPMGNFAICHYSRLQVGTEQIQVRYVIDFAEIPTIAEKQQMDLDHDGTVSSQERSLYLKRRRQELAEQLQLTSAGRSIPLTITQADLRFEVGAAGLETFRIIVDLSGALASTQTQFDYRDLNFPTRAGWKEIVVQAGSGVALHSSTVSAVDRSRELTAYPEKELPPQDIQARFSIKPRTENVRVSDGISASTTAPGAPEEAQSQQPISSTRGDAFTDTIAVSELNLDVMLLGLLVAFSFGALHALAPGHGKAMVAAYLVGSRGTARHAVLLGLVVTFTHTSGVFLCGLIALHLSRYVLPEQLYPWLGVVSGLTVLSVGFWLMYRRIRWLVRRFSPASSRRRNSTSGEGEGSAAESRPSHAHEIPEGPLTVRGLIALGVSGGLIPCPSALVVLLAAIALHRIAYGLLLIVAFSAGLAAVLVAIGLLVVWSGKWLERVPASRGLLRGLSVMSAVVITLIGLGLVMRSLSAVLV